MSDDVKQMVTNTKTTVRCWWCLINRLANCTFYIRKEVWEYCRCDEIWVLASVARIPAYLFTPHLTQHAGISSAIQVVESVSACGCHDNTTAWTTTHCELSVRQEGRHRSVFDKQWLMMDDDICLRLVFGVRGLCWTIAALMTLLLRVQCTSFPTTPSSSVRLHQARCWSSEICIWWQLSRPNYRGDANNSLQEITTASVVFGLINKY